MFTRRRYRLRLAQEWFQITENDDKETTNHLVLFVKFARLRSSILYDRQKTTQVSILKVVHFDNVT
ncbi:MAG: hypothetical protein J07HQW1_00908 [Haloquadratum walsbyi J07HQW1]|uniref:Uncharacterized protein n=1 Tax=Haloquadratum walsbyi J07HQW1 TaxID=1238424 RepID=U1N309_9EURY|nr:MAG: hypothetical protein J07HQW1_00908 [Haloquadratum walsbyi J07HQW1]